MEIFILGNWEMILWEESRYRETCQKSVLGFMFYATPLFSSGIPSSCWLLLDQIRATKKAFVRSWSRSTPSVPFRRNFSCGKYKRPSIWPCCQTSVQSPQVVHWSNLSYPQRCNIVVEGRKVSSIASFLPSFVVLFESIFVSFVVKRKFVGFYYILLTQIICCSVGFYFRTKVPKKVDEFDKILEASNWNSRRMEIMEPILSASQTARQSMSFITNSAREWLENTNSQVSHAQKSPGSDSEKNIDDLNRSIYASSREEWESEEELFGDEYGPTESILESPTNEPAVVRKEGSMYSMVFSTSKSASETHMDTTEPSSSVPCMKAEYRNTMQNIAPAVVTNVNDEEISISPPNLFHSFATVFSFVSTMIHCVTTIFQIFIMICRDIWFRCHPKFKTRASFYSPLVSSKDSILLFNRSWSKVANHFGYFPEYEFALDGSSDTATMMMDRSNVSIKESFTSFVHNVWKDWKDLGTHFDIWKSVSEPFQDRKEQ